MQGSKRQSGWQCRALGLALLLWGAGSYPALSQQNMDGGNLEARVLVTTRDHAILSSEVSARIAEMPKRPGQKFAKGDILAVFDCGAYRAQRASVAADVRQAEAQYEAQKRLAELRTVGELDVTIAHAVFEKTRAELQLQDFHLSRCKIAAPYDGAVVEWVGQPHQTANPGDQLIEIVGFGGLELELIVPSPSLAWLAPGHAVQARIDETGSEIAARIDRIGARIDPVSQSVRVYAVILDGQEKLLPGMSGTALIQNASKM
ncbi:efflux RND transporter periplasmic adaptor subunit [Thalassospira sp.]|uniref:efflux RND transporter periplasmic adaptor subunit n=1 Tax=Thalassospira sp. TaxID=1912094 RepID=UPI0027376DA0|nr:efflux RND transporter periplasmic adaptor subunit [Thalassospira sp.]MDP2699738.1 efflux RND transporter periplasmic adaptor subunit [Thalassospira sp.]